MAGNGGRGIHCANWQAMFKARVSGFSRTPSHIHTHNVLTLFKFLFSRLNHRLFTPALVFLFAHPVRHLDGIVSTRHVDSCHVGACHNTVSLVCICVFVLQLITVCPIGGKSSFNRPHPTFFFFFNL